MIYAVIDTNVVVSSLLSKHSDTATNLIMENTFSGKIIPLVSTKIYEEYVDVLNRDKFNFSKKTINLLLSLFSKRGMFILPTSTNEMLLDIKDKPFYETVIAGQNLNAYLITGNKKHFPNKSFIVTPREFLEIIVK